MFNHLNVHQSKELSERNISGNLIKKIYDIIHKDEIDPYLDNQTNLIGKINIGYTYQFYLDKIHEYFPDLEIIADGTYVYFEDKNVETLLINNFCNGYDGVMVNTRFDPSNGFYKNGRHIFQNNKQIEFFNELNQLTNAKIIGLTEFYGCSNLRSINLTNVNYIGGDSFRDCTNLEIDLYTPELNNMNEGAFRNSGITSISSLGNLQIIPRYAFLDCKNLITVNTGVFERITKIDGHSFAECTYLESISNAPSLTTIGEAAFERCLSLKNFILNSGIISIGHYAFNGSAQCIIDDLNLPNLTSLGAYAFNGSKLKKISNLGNITTIPTYCFYNCKDLTTIENDALLNITTIESYAFCYSAFTAINIPNVTIINDNAFAECASLTNISFDNNKITKIAGNAFVNNILLTIDDLNLPNLTSLGVYAFKNTKIKKVSNLGNITTIPEYCFYDCKNLASINLSNITNINARAFCYCTSLTNIDLSSITNLNYACFAECTNLTNINTDLSNLTKLDNDTIFVNAPITNDIVLSGLQSSGTNIGMQFCHTRIRSLTVSSGNFTEIGYRYNNNSFLGGNNNLLFVDFSECSSITTTSTYAFYNCTSLKLIKCNSSLTRIGACMCSGCTSLEAIYLPIETPPDESFIDTSYSIFESHIFHTSYNANTINSTINSTFKIYVPDASVELYKTAPYWSEYADHYAPISTYVEPAGIRNNS